MWDINDTFALTLGVRYAEDQVAAEENLFRYSETGADSFLALYGGLAVVNRINGGLVADADGNMIVPTEKVTNGGIPFALSVYRPFIRTDKKNYWTYQFRLECNRFGTGLFFRDLGLPLRWI